MEHEKEAPWHGVVAVVGMATSCSRELTPIMGGAENSTARL